MRSFADLVDDVAFQLKIEASSSSFWTETEIKNALNDIYHEIADELKCFKKTDVIEVKSGVYNYKLPEYHILGSLKRVEYDGKKIYPIEIDELDAYNENWRDDSGDIERYMLDLYASDEITVWRTPDTDGDTYSTASESQDQGVITTVENSSYVEFTAEEGVITTADGDPNFDESEGFGPVLAIRSETGNLKIFHSIYPKRLSNDSEVFLHPITYNPKRILTKGALGILLMKEGEGKDIIKANSWRNKFDIALKSMNRVKMPKTHVMRSISDYSMRGSFKRGRVNLGGDYPPYPSR